MRKDGEINFDLSKGRGGGAVAFEKAPQNFSNKKYIGCSREDNLHRVDFNLNLSAIVLRVYFKIFTHKTQPKRLS